MPPRVRSVNVEPGESEFSHGRGLRATRAQREQPIPNVEIGNLGTTRDAGQGEEPGPWPLSVYDQGKVVQRTDPAEPAAEAAYDAEPNTIHNKTQTRWVR